MTSSTLEGLNAFATNTTGSADHLTISIFSPFSSFTIACTLVPLGPTHEPTGSTSDYQNEQRFSNDLLLHVQQI